jgi:hypothetical protein
MILLALNAVRGVDVNGIAAGDGGLSWWLGNFFFRRSSISR